MYETLYDIRSTSPVNWSILFWGLVFIAIGLWFVLSYREDDTSGRPFWFRIVWLAFAVLWTMVAVGGPLSSHISNAAALAQGNVHLADGRIANFNTSSDCKNEHFTVAGHRFQYSYYEEMGRFNRPEPCGGPLRPGMYVRISYVNDDDIVRIETRVPSGRQR